MPENDSPNSSGPATATVEPPAPPSAPPATGIASAPQPKRRRWIAWVIGILAVLALIAAIVAAFVLVSRGHAPSAGSSQSATAFDSAMKKAGVKATAPSSPVELTSIEATGSHIFTADFTADEIAALVNAFPYSTTVSGQKLSVSNVSIQIPGDGSVTLSGNVALGDNAYNGSITGPVAFENGRITSTGATSASAEGFSISGAQAQQATQLLLDYLNSYLDASPGLKVEEARVAGTSIHVKGTAPDAITTP